MLRLFALCALLGAAFVLSASHAIACGKYPPQRVVGDVSDPLHGAECTDDSIQAAIDNATGDPACPDKIYITGEHLYTSHFCDPNHNGSCQLNINGKSLQLIGWNGNGVHCGDVPAPRCGVLLNCGTSPGAVSLNGEDSTRVLTITGTSNVTLRNVIATHGYNFGNGGGVSFNGAGSLSLYNSSVSQSTTTSSGGGINVNGSGTGATLYLGSGTQIIGNTANGSGGGLRITGSTHLYAIEPQTWIFDNHALGAYGGGLQIVGPAQADIGSPGFINGVFFLNDAVDGGAISVNSGQDQDLDALLRMFTTDATKPVTLADNFASSKGGAIYLKSYSSSGGPFGGSFSTAVACLSNFRIIENQASDGAAIYADWDSSLEGLDIGSIVQINRTYPDVSGTSEQCDPGVAGDLGAVGCAPGTPCNDISNNIVEDGNNQPTGGAVVFIGHEGGLYADNLVIDHNTGGRVLRQIGENDPDIIPTFAPALHNCLIVDNAVSSELLRTEENSRGDFALESCTISHNSIGTTGIVSAADGLKLTYNLIDQPGRTITATAAQYVLASNVSGLPSDVTIQTVGDPAFLDPAHGDYHLGIASPAIDYAGGIGGTDLEGYPRDVDLPTHPNTFGPRDVGAYERQSPYACDNSGDYLFCSGFETQ